MLAAVAAFAGPVSAQQRLSLAERVERLEQQASGQGGGAVELVNQIQALQSQVQSLQGQVEELKHALDESKQRNKDQYTDLDSRLGRLEGHGGAPAGAAPGARAPSQPEQPPEIDLANPGGRPSASAPRGNVGALTADDRAAIAPGEPASRETMPSEPAAAPTTVAKAPADPAAEGATYNEAFAALKDGRYAESARRFQTFIDQYPDSDLTGNAYYWLGESYYVTQNYKIAQDAFQTLLERYPNSQKAPDALLKVGYSQYEQKQWDQAEATLNDVVQKYPDTTVARLAQGRLRALQSESRH
ncbi:MAG TPA: tol-pal system protein YbgF [Dokdonella sp.]|nr:tol-pal system protein YbgF [Dokdonella sp.]